MKKGIKEGWSLISPFLNLLPYFLPSFLPFFLSLPYFYDFDPLIIITFTSIHLLWAIRFLLLLVSSLQSPWWSITTDNTNISEAPFLFRWITCETLCFLLLVVCSPPGGVLPLITQMFLSLLHGTLPNTEAPFSFRWITCETTVLPRRGHFHHAPLQCHLLDSVRINRNWKH